MVKILLINGVNIDGATGAAARVAPPPPPQQLKTWVHHKYVLVHPN